VLFDVAKELSDWFPPLVCCLGGIDALIVDDSIPRVDKLKVSLTKVDTKDHRVEVERRTQLAKFALQLHYPAP